jgi:putative ABC transport system permease protein
VKLLLRLLVHLYPLTFRRRHGAEMIDAWELDRLAAVRAGGSASAAFWLHMARDLCATAARQRVNQLRQAVVTRTGRGSPRLPHQPKRSPMDTLLQDVRYALRQFARRPGFAAIAVLSLALGIGGTTLIYGLIDGLVLHPFPYPDADRLVGIGVTFPRVSSDTTYVEVVSPAEYADLRGSRTFSHVAAFDLGNRNISGGDVPERVFTALLLDDLFPVIGMRPAIGRGFTREELGPNGPRVAILSHRLWRTRFGGDAAILNRPIRIGGETASVVGVMPPGLLVIGTDMWIPWGGDPAAVPRNVRQFTILARLAPGASLAQANAEMAAIAQSVERTHHDRFKEYEGWRLTVTPWAAALLQDVRQAAFMILGAVVLVLLIACANLTNLFLARSTTRQREMAVRIALGAARWRIAHHVLIESVLLAFAGAGTGLLLTYFGLAASQALIPSPFQMLGLQATLTSRVLAWSLALVPAAAVLVGLIPALQATRTDPHDSLKSDGRTIVSRRASRLRHTLVVAEIALAVMLLLGAGLLMRSFINIQQTERGFDARGVLTMRLTLPRERYASSEAINAFFARLLDRVEAIPGVSSAAMSSQFPPMATFGAQIQIEGAQASGVSLPTASTTIVSRRYFETIGVRILGGRGFDQTDRPGAPRVVIVNQAFADEYLHGRPPVGARIRIGPDQPDASWSEIVGVVGDARNRGLASAVRPEVFISMEHGRDTWNQLFLLVRSARPSTAILADVRKAVSSVDPEQPIYAVQTLEEAIAQSSFQQRIAAILLGLFAAIALALAVIGIYGVMAYAVTARTQEMGLRLAIGAQRADVIWLVLGQVLRLSAAGLAIGVALLAATGRAARGMLYGVTATDPVTIAAVTCALTLVALAAAWLPAWRASHVDPIEALRYE